MATPDNHRSSEFVPLDQEQEVLDVVSSSVFSLWEAVNNLTRLRPTKPRVTGILFLLAEFTSATDRVRGGHHRYVWLTGTSRGGR